MCGFSALAPAQSTNKIDLPTDTGNYKIGAGDVLNVVVVKQQILSGEVRVSNEGTVRLLMLDEPIPAACLSEDQLSREIANRYKGKNLLLNPQVYVNVKEFNANPVTVIGAVATPKTFQVQRPTRLFDIISQVNGPAANAGRTVQIFRNPNARPCEQPAAETPTPTTVDETTAREIISLPLADLLNGNDAANPFIQGGDVIRVTEAELKQAFVIGNVKSAVTVNLKEPITLSRAIAMAGGFAPGAQTDKIKISRQSTGDLSKSEIVVNLKDKKGEAQSDIVLQPNDVVDVPGPKRSVLKDIVKGILQTGMRVPMIP